MASMRELEVNLISAKNLKKVTLLSKQQPSAAVSFSGTRDRKYSAATKESSTDPIWNERYIFQVPEDALLTPNATILIQIYSSPNAKGDVVGTVRIPVSSCLQKTGEALFSAYNVLRPSGRVQGTLNASIKVSGPAFSAEQLERARRPPPAPAGYGAYGAYGQQPGGYPPQFQQQTGYNPYPPTAGGYPPSYPPQYQQGGYPQQAGYPQGPPPPGFYRPQQPQVIVVNRGAQGGYGGGYGGGGMMGGGMGGMGAGLLLGGIGGLALGEALDNDGGGCGGGCGGGGCGG